MTYFLKFLFYPSLFCPSDTHKKAYLLLFIIRYTKELRILRNGEAVKYFKWSEILTEELFVVIDSLPHIYFEIDAPFF